MATSGFDWSGLLNAGVNLYAASRNSNQNQSSANNYANATKFNPYNISAGNSGVLFNGNNAAASLSPAYQGLQSQLTSGASGLLGGLGGAYANGGINPFLQGSFDTYNQQSADPSSLAGFGTPQGALSTNIGDKFNATSQGFLGGLGSFNSNQAASDYTNNLRQQASTGNANQAENLAQGLFNSGRLGSTGGANIYGQLVQAQNQQDLQFQQAGRDYAGQEQNRLAGLAQGFGQLGTGINQQYAQTNDQFTNSAFNRASTVNQLTNQRATQRFQNAMNLFGAGQTGIQNQLSGGLGLLGGSTGLDQNLLQTIMTGGYLGGASSSANSNAYNPQMQANVAGNNAQSAGLLGLLDSSGLLNQAGGWLGSLFGGSGSNGLQAGTPGMPNVNGMTDQQLQNWLGSPPSLSSSFNSAGGQAADTSGNGLLSSLFGGDYNFLGGAAQIGNGMQNLNYNDQIQQYATQGISGLNDTLNSDPNMQAAGGGLNGLLGQAGNVAGIYSGIQQGGITGYANAANSAAGLFGGSIPAVNYANAVDQAVHGDVPGAAVSAVSTAVPLAGLGFAAAGLINKSLGVGEKGAITGAYTDAANATRVYAGKVLAGYQFPDGKYYTQTQAAALADAWKNGDTDKYNKLLASYTGKPADGYVVSGSVIKKG